jgi:hypothetical protein
MEFASSCFMKDTNDGRFSVFDFFDGGVSSILAGRFLFVVFSRGVSILFSLMRDVCCNAITEEVNEIHVKTCV